MPWDASASRFMLLIEAQRSMRAMPEPVEDVGHELLEAHVLDAGHAFGALEIRRRAIAADLPLARVVDQELRHLAERTAFLAVVDDEAHAALLRHLDADFDAVREVGAARADVGAEHVGAVALVVDAAGDLGRRRLPSCADVAEEVERHPADRRQEDVQIGTRDELREHAAGLLERARGEARPSATLEAPRDAGQMPDRIDRRLGHAARRRWHAGSFRPASGGRPRRHPSSPAC